MRFGRGRRDRAVAPHRAQDVHRDTLELVAATLVEGPHPDGARVGVGPAGDVVRVIPVLIAPGQTAVTPILCGPSSMRKASVKPNTANFVLEYAHMTGEARCPAEDAIYPPPRRARIWGRSMVVRMPGGAAQTNGTALTARLAV